jgi:hypothetical protein
MERRPEGRLSGEPPAEERDRRRERTPRRVAGDLCCLSSHRQFRQEVEDFARTMIEISSSRVVDEGDE